MSKLSRWEQWIEDQGQTEIARRLGVHRSAVHNWRHGKAQPGWKMVHRIVRISDGWLKAKDIRPDIYG